MENDKFEKTKEMIERLYESNKVEQMSDDDELLQNNDFQKGAVYGRSKTLKILLEWIKSKGEI